jgi:hypothetical protein
LRGFWPKGFEARWVRTAPGGKQTPHVKILGGSRTYRLPLFCSSVEKPGAVSAV